MSLYSGKGISIMTHDEKVYRELAVQAIAIMDERGRRNEGDNSRLLWNNEWESLRTRLFEVVQRIDSKKERGSL